MIWKFQIDACTFFKVTSHFIIDAVTFQGPIVIQSLESVLASFQQTLRLPYLQVTAGGLFVDSVPTDQGDVGWFVRCAKQCEAVFLAPIMVIQGAMGAIV